METVTRHFRLAVRQSDVGRKKTARIPSRYRCVLILAVFFSLSLGCVCVCVCGDKPSCEHTRPNKGRQVGGRMVVVVGSVRKDGHVLVELVWLSALQAHSTVAFCRTAYAIFALPQAPHAQPCPIRIRYKIRVCQMDGCGFVNNGRGGRQTHGSTLNFNFQPMAIRVGDNQPADDPLIP